MKNEEMAMARELNRDLFMDKLKDELEASVPPPPMYAKVEEVKHVSLHVEYTQRRVKELESRIEQLTTKVDEMLGGNKQRFERIQGHFNRQTEMVQTGFHDLNTKVANLASRLNERRVSENQMKELVERHQQMVQTFEVRMQQMQKVMSEQEFQLMGARAEIKEAVREISRLKKL
jgi:chromosome segregation ATPase